MNTLLSCPTSLRRKYHKRGNNYLNIISNGRREGRLGSPKLNTTSYKNHYKYKAFLMSNILPSAI